MENAATRMVRGQNPIRHHLRRQIRQSVMAKPAPHTRFLTVPTPGCRSGGPCVRLPDHVSIDRSFGLIRRWDASGAAAYEGARLREGLLDKINTASSVWADTADRSKANEEFLARNGFVSVSSRALSASLM